MEVRKKKKRNPPEESYTEGKGDSQQREIWKDLADKLRTPQQLREGIKRLIRWEPRRFTENISELWRLSQITHALQPQTTVKIQCTGPAEAIHTVQVKGQPLIKKPCDSQTWHQYLFETRLSDKILALMLTAKDEYPSRAERDASQTLADLIYGELQENNPFSASQLLTQAEESLR